MKIVLETDRLLLRHFTLDDVDDLLGIFSDPEAMRHYPATKGRQETIEWIDYSFLREQWNLGFATETAIACRNFGFTNLDRTHLVSLIDPENGASKRVAEKVGMSREKEIDRWSKRIQVYGVAR